MFAGKSVVILGAARQGKALARWLFARGARVTLSDTQTAPDVADLRDLAGSITFALGGHPLSLLDGCDLLCLSGGVPIDLPIVLEARRRGIALSNDSQIFFDVCPPTRSGVIGITGSAGKTTTTTLVGEMLKARRDAATVWVGGNIGNPLIGDVERIGPQDDVVIELSSFQLELLTVSPRIACITNVTPNHLDRHGTMEAYTAAKRRILEFQSGDDWAVLSADDAVGSRLDARGRVARFSLLTEPRGEGAWLAPSGDLMVRLPGGRAGAICHRAELLLMGDHNVLNVLAAASVAGLAGADAAAMRAVATTFRGVAHRLQLVRDWRGVRWYDDSIATAPERLMAALRCFDAPVVLLCGGRDKHLPWEDAVALMADRCKHIVLFGEMAPMVGAHFDAGGPAAGRVTRTQAGALEDAVRVAASVAEAGDVVLLSPGGTSYDAFKDFAERGDRFKALVCGLE